MEAGGSVGPLILLQLTAMGGEEKSDSAAFFLSMFFLQSFWAKLPSELLLFIGFLFVSSVTNEHKTKPGSRAPIWKLSRLAQMV